jgi:hypothetical protein
MDKELKERSPYMHYWIYEEKDVLKEIYCEKCGRSLRWRECDECGHKLDEW